MTWIRTWAIRLAHLSILLWGVFSGVVILHGMTPAATRIAYVESYCHVGPSTLLRSLWAVDANINYDAVESFGSALDRGFVPLAVMGSNALSLIGRGMSFGYYNPGFIDVPCRTA